MSGGMTVNPVVSEGDDGQEYIADFEVAPSRNFIDRNGQVAGFEDDFSQDENGEWHYNTPEDPDQYVEENSADQQYIDAVLEAYPQLPDALAAAADSLPEEIVNQYNEALERGEWDKVMPFIEQIIRDYNDGTIAEDTSDAEEEDEGDTEEGDETYLDDWSEEELVALDEQVQPLIQAEATDYLADSFKELAENTFDNETLKGVYAATAAFHASEVTAEEAIQYVINNYPKDEVIAAYQYMTENY